MNVLMRIWLEDGLLRFEFNNLSSEKRDYKKVEKKWLKVIFFSFINASFTSLFNRMFKSLTH